ncbi:MAG TPA: hypothetical protein PK156_36510 [Polyangium sp.]|nr:hypothetical protein [Polyangium sp.]
MAPLSFVHVPQAAFSSFSVALLAFPWTLVDASDFELAPNDLVNAPFLVLVKLRLSQAVEALRALTHGFAGRDSMAWAQQKQLCAVLDLASRSSDPAKRDAARRLQQMFLFDVGEAQSNEQSLEIDMAHIQMSLVEHGQAEADVQLLGIEPLLNEIAMNSESFSNGSKSEGVTSFSRKKAAAMASCVGTFAWATEALALFVARMAAGPEKELAQALLGSLVHLSTQSAIAAPNRGTSGALPPWVH